MNETTKHAPGTFCWPELSTTDQTGAKKFYGALFGWDHEDVPIGPDGVYTMFKIDDKELGAVHDMQAQERAMGIPPHWVSYVSTASADETLAKAKTLGGSVLMGPFDVMDAGRMGVIQDPTGATFAVWQANKHIGARVVDQAGSLVWTELMSTNAESARDFYSQLFGWGIQLHQMGPMTYTVFMRDQTAAGGMMQMTPDMGNMPSHWLVYFGVTDTDATASKTTSLGGRVIIPPADIPNVGRFSVLQDPQGATFGVIKFAQPV